MKINIHHIDNDIKGTNIMLQLIVAELLEELEELGEGAEDIQLEELSATFTVKPKDEEDYFILSADHDGVKELLEIDYNLRAGIREDNIESSYFSEEDKLQVMDDLGREFETVEPKLVDEELMFTDQEVIGDMVVRNFKFIDGRKATRVFQVDKGTQDLRLIQEFTYKEPEEESAEVTAEDMEEEVK